MNILHNALFRIWDYGVGPFTSTGRTATRWTLTLTSGAVSVAPVVHGSSTAYHKMFRGLTGLRASVSTTGEMKISQSVAEARAYIPCHCIIRVICFGPAGGSFEFGAINRRSVVKTRGATNMVSATFRTTLQDFASPVGGQGEVVLFENPTMVGDYDFAYVQIDFGVAEPPPLMPVAPSADRMRYLDLVRPVAGLRGLASSTSIIRPVAMFGSPMRDTPSFVTLNPSVTTIRIDSGAVAVHGAPSISSPERTAWGGRILVQGLSGLNTGSEYIVNVTNAGDVLGVFDADFPP